MNTVTIYRFKVYDSSNDELRESQRWGTLGAISKIPLAQPIEGTAIDVDASVIQSDVPGLTAKGFWPARSSGFQTAVK